MKNLFKIFLGLVIATNAIAQQDAEYSMYFLNGMYYNPAYAGSKEHLHISGIYRHQWDNIQGAPRSGSISVHSPLKKDQYALGLTFNYDKLGNYQHKSLVGNFAYRIKTKGTTKISLGVSLGVQNFNQWRGIVNEDDDNSNTVLSGWMPNVGIGAYVFDKKYYVGLSAPHILNTVLSDSFAISSNSNIARMYNHYYLTGGYVFGKEIADIKFMPSLMIKYVPSVSLQFEPTANFIFKDMVMLGVSYRTNGDNDNAKGESVIGIFRIMPIKNLDIAYAYDHSLSKLQGYNSGTHEVMLGYTFGGSNLKRVVTPRFITYF